VNGGTSGKAGKKRAGDPRKAVKAIEISEFGKGERGGRKEL